MSTRNGEAARMFGVSPVTDPRLGLRVVDRYQLTAVIGRGSMGVVYEAEDRLLGREVALKVLHTNGRLDAELRQKFELSAEAVIGLEHQHVVRYLDVGQLEDGTPFLVMERLHGETLAEYLDRQRDMPQELAVRLFRQIAEGLEAAHAGGIIHLDIKPDNLYLVGPPGEPELAKLLDFGLARTAAEASISESGSDLVMGTREYMAPEQVLGEETDARTDVYGLGMTLFRALSGELPFEAPRHSGVLAHQVHSLPPPVSWLVDDAWHGLDEVVETATRKAPDNRYSSMAELSAALQRVAYGLPVERRPLRVEPDRYEPTSELGERASRLFASLLG